MCEQNVTKCTTTNSLFLLTTGYSDNLQGSQMNAILDINIRM